MWKSFLLFSMYIFLMSMPLSAGEEPLEASEESVSPYFIIIKAMGTKGGTMHEEEALLEGDHGYGAGISVGYRLHPRFSIELEGTYSRNDIEKSEEQHGELESENASAIYHTYAIQLVYKQPLSEGFILFGKLGYEVENEKVSSHDIDETKYGMDYAFGIGYELDEHYAVVAEYANSSIGGLRGPAYFLGIEYVF
ncbi:MAG: porin family protein [Campylobacterota bacterium]|nr:porin family protein [Campylobacterota bacterium]